jgi:transposase
MRWLLNDRDVSTQDYARKVLELLVEGATALVPNLWFLEAVNVILKEMKKGNVTQADASQFIALLGELDRLQVIQALVDGGMKPRHAAQRLGLSTREVRRLVERYEAQGATGLLSQKRNRPSNNRLDPELAEVALTIIRERYADFGPTLACEKLSELHGLELSKETVRKLMTEVGLWIPRCPRPSTIYQPRNPRHCLGELVQIDSSDHAWVEDRAPVCTLLAYVDDALSQILQLHFTPSESTSSYFGATRAYIERYGKPEAFYNDKASVFRVNQKNATSGDGHTQFGRALYELNIEGICANSSQAKGRVERANLTLQDRLVKELRLQDIIQGALLINAPCAQRSSAVPRPVAGSDPDSTASHPGLALRQPVNAHRYSQCQRH